MNKCVTEDHVKGVHEACRLAAKFATPPNSFELATHFHGIIVTIVVVVAIVIYLLI